MLHNYHNFLTNYVRNINLLSLLKDTLQMIDNLSPKERLHMSLTKKYIVHSIKNHLGPPKRKSANLVDSTL